MRAGALRDTIILEKEVTFRDEFGGEVRSWEETFRLKADVKFDNGTQILENRETFNAMVCRMEIYFREGITRQMRVLYDGEKYRILSANKDRRLNRIELICELINE